MSSVSFMPNGQTKKKKKFDIRAWLFVWSVLLVPVILFIFSNVYLNLETFKLAFQNVRGEWTLGNFEWAIKDFTSEKGVMWEALRNTLIFFVTELIFINLLSMFLSYFLYKRIAGYKIFRIVMYLPSIIGSVAFSLVFKAIIGVGGPICEIITNIKGYCPEFFDDSRYALKMILFYQVWTGLGGLLYQGAMARIPTDIFEAAILDGITPFQELIKIVIPMIWPTITTIFILSFSGIFSASGPILLFTKGTVGTMTISFWLWDQVYTYNAVHSSAAVGMIYTVIGCPLCLAVRKIMLRVQENVEY